MPGSKNFLALRLKSVLRLTQQMVANLKLLTDTHFCDSLETQAF